MMFRPSLRTRLTALFAAGALIVSGAVALLSYELTRGTLMNGRERTAVRAAYYDVAVIRAGLAADDPDIATVLGALNTGSTRRPVLRRDETWYARNLDLGVTEAVPASLVRLVHSGQPGIQRVGTESGAALVIGVPIDDRTAFYVVDSLGELEHTLEVLSWVLVVVAVATTTGGAALGWYATRRSLRPLSSVAAAAREISAGDLTARLDPGAEPELDALTSSFNDMVDQLAHRMERDRRFAADVSHELRSPLQTLSAAADVLTRRRATLDPRTATAVDLLAEEVARFQVLVTDLLELARTDQPVQRQAVDVAELGRQLCRRRGLPVDVVTVHGDADTVWDVDPRRFERVVANLLDNADKHGGGTVAIGIGRVGQHRFLDIDDSGPGVRPDDRATIFDRFVRGSAGARGENDGTGLGLALVAQHVAAHGGDVTVLDRPGGGARFRIRLPASPS